MKKIFNTIKSLFSKKIFAGKNTRSQFFIYHLLIGLFFVVPANTYLQQEDTVIGFEVISTVSLLIGFYLISINTIRRANMTHIPVMGYVGVVAIIIGQIYGYPLNVLYQLVAILLLVLPNKKIDHE